VIDPPQLHVMANEVTCSRCHIRLFIARIGVDPAGLFIQCPYCDQRDRPRDGMIMVALG
jgi:hypothetical protein